MSSLYMGSPFGLRLAGWHLDLIPRGDRYKDDTRRPAWLAMKKGNRNSTHGEL